MRERPERRPRQRSQRLQIWLQQRLESLTGKVVLLLGAVVLLTLAGATIIYTGLGAVPSYLDAIWWALDHLLDPGSLSDDEGWSQRLVGLVLTVAGLVVLAGLLFALLTEAVDRSLQRLANVELPVHTHDHLLIVGWDDGLAEVLRALDFLRPRLLAGAAPPFRDIVVLAPEAVRDQRAHILELLRRAVPWSNPQVVVGDLVRPETYALGAARDAYAIVVSGTAPAEQGVAAADAAALQAAATLARYLDHPDAPAPTRQPLVSVILYFGEHADAAGAILPPAFDDIVVDRVVTGMLAVELTAPAWGHALRGFLLNVEGAQVHLVQDASLSGAPFGELAGRFEAAVPIGLLRPAGAGWAVEIAPPAATPVEKDDAVVVLAESTQAAQRLRQASAPPAAGWPLQPPDATTQEARTILAVGFNHRIMALLRELASTPSTHFQVISLSQLPAAARQQTLPRWVRDDLTIQYLEDSPSDLVSLSRIIADSNPDAIIVSSDWAAERIRAPDARAVFSYLGIRRIVQDRIPVLAVAYSSAYAQLLGQRDGANLPGAYDMIGGTLAWTLLRADIMPVLDALFDPYRVTLRSWRGPDSAGEPARFDALYQDALRQGAVLAGIVRPDRTPWLAPPPDTPVAPGTELLLITAAADTRRGAPAERGTAAIQSS